MRRQRLIAFVFCLGLCLVTGARAEMVTIAYLQDGLNELQKSEKQVALQLWAEELISEGDFKVKILPINTMSRLQELIKTKAVSYAIINSVHYLKQHKQLIEYLDHNLWAIQRSDALYEEYVIVTRKQKNFKNFKQLSGAIFSIAKDNPLINFYTNYLVLKAGYPATTFFFKKIRNTPTASQAVLDVFFGKSDACIVPRHILDMAVELNPAIMVRLEIIHRSGASFIPVLILGAADNPASINSVFTNSIRRIQESPRGEQIINLFKIHSAVMIGADKLSAMSSIYSEYQRLLALER
ncbi:MAG: PhnD/SsuA/transferrin family substrate-binding protein [Gammaproteobacteria bacterium]